MAGMSAYGKKNVGDNDRKYRGIAAGIAAVLGLFTKGGARGFFCAVAVVLGVTAVTRSCPVYSFLGVDTAA